MSKSKKDYRTYIIATATPTSIMDAKSAVLSGIKTNSSRVSIKHYRVALDIADAGKN